LKTFKQFRADIESAVAPPFIDEVLIVSEDFSVELLQEGKWISGRFPDNIRIDLATHGAGQTHGHVYGRKGNELLAVNVDGTASHGTKGRIHDRDAAALRGRGFSLRADNIVEWLSVGTWPQLLLG
jgi:hypothetical protein